MSGLTVRLARFIAEARGLSLSDDVLRIAKTGFIDTVATMLGGRSETVVGLVSKLCPPGDEASVLFGVRRASARDAALINGTAGHVMDYDDVSLHGHPSVVLVPAVLAEAERLGLSGLDVLRAYVVGYETWAELATREPDPLHGSSWHPTAMYGTIGAAAAIASLNGFDETRALKTLSIAASLAGGLIGNFGSMMKPYQAGKAAANGIDAARMADIGLSGNSDVLEHRLGFMAAISPKGRADRERSADALGKDLHILHHGLSFKKYPVCYASHRAIDGVIDLATAHNIDAAKVRNVRVAISATELSALHKHDPQTGLEAKFSIQHAVAAALVDRKVTREQLTDAYVKQTPVRTIFEKVQTELVEKPCPVEAGMGFFNRVVIEMNDGKTLDSGDIRFARGHAKLPLTDKDLEAKFMDCAADVAWIQPDALLKKLFGLENMDTIQRLAAYSVRNRWEEIL